MVGRKMDIPVHSIDTLIITSLVDCDNLASIKVAETIDATFQEIASETDLIGRPDKGLRILTFPMSFNS